jgi:hypothetical protein
MKRYCFYWSTPNHIAWPRADWTWADCELINEICARWGTEGAWWVDEKMKWSECSSSAPPAICAIWGTTNVWWKNVNWYWSQCSGSITPPTPPFTASLQPPGVDATTLVQPWLITPWNPYTTNDEHDKKRKRLIKLICKVKGETYEEEKMVGTMNISVDDIKMVVKAISNIDLDVKFEE